MGPQDLAQVLRRLPPPSDPNVLVGAETNDDAAAYRLSDELALIETVDFITPIVDDPYTYGAIATANALSDIYAMGARPVIALSIVGFPIKSFPIDVLGDIMQGSTDKAAEAGVSIVGGHSIDDNEPKFGLAVTGLVHPAKIITNAGARPGDVLVLTKPLGTGIITTGIDRRLVDRRTIERVVSVMASLNRSASEAMVSVGVNACTDVTGFGLLGHLRTMAKASGVGASISLSSVPVLAGVWDLVEAGAVPEGTHNNHRSLQEEVSWSPEISREAQLVLCDAQTSGGLLIAVAPDRLETLLRTLKERGVETSEIGRILGKGAGLRVTA